MLNRRVAMTAAAVSAVVMITWMPVRPARAQSGPEAITFVKSTSDQLVAVVNSSDTVQEKRRRLRQVLDATVDIDDLARFCLGRFWRIATPAQQAEYLPLFHELLVLEIAGHLGDYRGVRVTMGPARTAADTEIVITTVERPTSPANQVDWVVSTTSGSPKVVDLLAGGTSLRLTQSADFTSYLSRHQYNIHELITGLQQQIAQNE